MWHWGREQGAIEGTSSWTNAYDGNDAGVGGQHYNAPARPFFGGIWNNGVLCGSRGSDWANDALYLYSDSAGRGCADPAYFD